MERRYFCMFFSDERGFFCFRFSEYGLWELGCWILGLCVVSVVSCCRCRIEGYR